MLDSDAWIKLYKSGLLGKVCEAFDCMMTVPVFEEVVLAGMRASYEDASAINALVVQKRARMLPRWGIKHHLPVIGNGEASVLDACVRLGCAAVSDDARFISLLEKRGVAFHTPASLIVGMCLGKIAGRKEAAEALGLLRPWIRESVFQASLKALEG